jgi:hemin uptake protein HemP
MSAVSDEGVAHDPAHQPPTIRTIRIIDTRIESSDLFVGTRELTIGHGDDVYRLRLTAQNKLILTK